MSKRNRAASIIFLILSSVGCVAQREVVPTLALPTQTTVPVFTQALVITPTENATLANVPSIVPTTESFTKLASLSLPEFNARYSTRVFALTADRQIMAVIAKNRIDGSESVWLWNVKDFDHSLTAYQKVFDRLTSVAFSPDDNKLAIGGERTIIILNWKTGELIDQIFLPNSEDYAVRMAFGSNDILFSSDYDGELIAWNLVTREVKYSVEISPSLLLGNFVISPDGQTLVASRYHEIHFWDLATGKSIKVIENSDLGLLSSFAYSPDGKLLATGGCGVWGNETCLAGKLYIWKYPFESPSINISRHSSNITVGEFNPGGNLLAVAAGTESAEFFDLSSGQFIHAPSLDLKEKLPPNDSFYISDSGFLSDGKVFALSTTNGIQLLDIADMSWKPNLSFILSLGYSYTITTAGNNLNFRTEPSMKAEIIRKLHTGESISIIDGPRIADDYVWWKVKTSDDTEGWIVEMPGWYEFIP